MAIDKIESAGLATSTNQPNFRNIIINGDMSIAQRGTSSTSNGYCLDRFTMDESTDGAVTVSQDTTVPSGQGFAKSLKVDVTTADSSIAAAQYCGFTQFIEGQNLQYLKYGTSSAESLTLSFWVRSTKTGTYCVRFVKEAGSGTRYECPIEYTISSSDTWEKKTITLSPTAGSTSLITATAGAIVNSNASGFRVFWTLAAGTDYHGTNNTWTSTSDRLSTSNQVNFLDNTSNNFYITGVQFEVGTSASDFEFLPTDVNLQRCYRYFQLINTGGVGKIIGTGGAYDNNTLLLTYTWVPKRTTPSLYQVSGTGYFYFYGSGSENDAFDLWKIYSPNYLHGLIYSDDSSISVSDNVLGWFQLNNSAAVLGLQAEL
jgi:hypothetical protein